MKKLLTLLLTDHTSNTNSQPREKKSFIDIKVRINEDLLMKLLSWVLGISIAGGGFYGFSNIFNILTPPDNEVFDSPNQTESVKLSFNLQQ